MKRLGFAGVSSPCRRPSRTFFGSVVFLCLLAGAIAADNISSSGTIPDAELEQFGRKIEARCRAGDIRFYANAFDVDGLLQRSLPRQSGQAMDNLRGDIRNEFPLAVARSIRPGSEFKFLRLKFVNNEPRLLMRLTVFGGGLNYQELMVVRKPDGALAIADIFVYGTGETLSATLKRCMLPVLGQKQRSPSERFLRGTEDLWNEKAGGAGTNDPRQVVQHFANLPPNTQKERFALTQQILAAAQVDDRAFQEAIFLWRYTYPNDPSLDLVTLDAFLLRQDHSNVLASIDRLDKAVGGDPYLDALRCNVYEAMNDLPKARIAAQRALQREPTLLQPQYFMVHDFVRQRRFSDAIALLTRMEATADLSHTALVTRIEKDKINAPLLETDVYRNWRGMVGTSGNSKSHSVAPPKPTGLKLQGIFYSPAGRSTAMINQTTVFVGERVGGYTVSSIAPHSVTVNAADGSAAVLRLEDVAR